MLDRDVVITGVGTVGAFGPHVDALRDCMDGGAIETRRFDLTLGFLTVGYAGWRVRQQWPEAPARLGRMDRSSQHFLLAGWQALTAAGLSANQRKHTGLVLGTRFGCLLVNEAYHRGLLLKGYRLASPLLFGYTVPSAPAGELSIAMGLEGPNLTVMDGDASGGSAVARGAAWIRHGRVDRVVAGGCDTQGPWLAQELHDAGVRDGDASVPAEAAAVLVLEAAQTARARGARVLGVVHGAREGFGDPDAGDPGDPLAPIVGRTYAAAAPLAVVAMAQGLRRFGTVTVRDELGYWARLDIGGPE